MLAPETCLKDRYRIVHKIGDGGFGYVYKAIDEVFGCAVAIKETTEEVANQAKLRRAFEREAKLLRNLKHDALPRVTDYFFQGGAQFLVMDFIQGEDLASLLTQRLQLKQGPFACEDILPLADKILDALDYLHTRPEPIIHRDIKPANLKLADDGGVYLLDFGLAKGVAGQMSTIVEGQPSFVVPGFTREYAPLEQLQGTANKPQSDVFAFAATLYHLLTGQLPIAATERDEALQRGQADPLQPAHEANPAIPLAVSEIISQALVLRWWDRIASASEMCSALDRARAEFSVMQPDSASQHTPEPGSSDTGGEVAQLPLDPKALKSSGKFFRWLLWAGLVLVVLTGVALVRPLIYLPSLVSHQAAVTKATPSPPTEPSASVSTPANLSLKHELKEHKGIIWSVAFSLDGTLAASGSEDSTIILWDTLTWTRKFTLEGNSGPVYSVAFSPDGKTLASGSRDAGITLWNTQTGHVTEVLARADTRPPVLRLAFSRDGNFLASCSGQKPEKGGEEIRLWEVRNEWKSRLFGGQVKGVFAMVFSSDSSTLVSAGLDKKMRLWNVAANSVGQEFDVDQPMTTLALSEDGRYLACGSRDATIRLWLYQPSTYRWAELERLGRHQEHKGYLTATAFSADNKTLVAASADGTIRLWDVDAHSSKPLIINQSAKQATQWSAAFSPDGQTLAAGGQDKIVRVWQ